jgi:Fe-S-cluster containining protein
MSEDAVRRTCSFDVCCECAQSCCQDAKPPLTKERMKIIENYLKSHERIDGSIFTNSGYSFPSVDSIGFCVFYDKGTKKCRVHEVKPETCRAGPITFDINFYTKKIEWFLKTRELCLFAGKLFETPEQLNQHLKVAKQEITRLICNLEPAALQAILKIDEPQTFKIGEDPLPKEVLEKLGIK